MKFKSVVNEEFKAVIVAHESLGIKLSAKFVKKQIIEKTAEVDVVVRRS